MEYVRILIVGKQILCIPNVDVVHTCTQRRREQDDLDSDMQADAESRVVTRRMDIGDESMALSTDLQLEELEKSMSMEDLLNFNEGLLFTSTSKRLTRCQRCEGG